MNQPDSVPKGEYIRVLISYPDLYLSQHVQLCEGVYTYGGILYSIIVGTVCILSPVEKTTGRWRDDEVDQLIAIPILARNRRRAKKW